MENIVKLDTLIIGAGAAGMMCAIEASSQGKSVGIIEHNKVPGRKILISGGGRCNFTNINTKPSEYESKNRHFCKSALSLYSPQDFIALVEKYNIEYYEKKLGQLFCKKSAKDLIKALETELKKNKVRLFYDHKNTLVEKIDDTFHCTSEDKKFISQNLVIATGGLSISQIGASDFGYKIARQFGHKIVETRPALVPYKYDRFSTLSGISLVGEIKTNKHSVTEDILFTHKGFSGPAILKSSLHWCPGDYVRINWLPNFKLRDAIEANLQSNLFNILREELPNRFIEEFLTVLEIDFKTKICEISKKKINFLIENLQNFTIIPQGTEGYRKAEVTIGGVDTKTVSSKTMESSLCPNLFFIGEVLDVSGQLGGYNFQWAWASAYACASHIK